MNRGARAVMVRLMLMVCAGACMGVIAQVRSQRSAAGAVVGVRALHRGAVQKPRHGPFALVLVIDAARFDEVDLKKMPNLARLVAGGTTYTRAWVGQLPSITETSHATIGTGVLPFRHLILGDKWRIPGTDQMSPDLLDAQLTRTGYIGKFIHQKGVPDIATFVHRKFPGSLVATLSGHKVYAADALGAGSADFVAFGMKDARGHYIPGAIPGHEPGEAILKSKQLDLPAYPRNGTEDEWTTTLAEKFLFKYHPRLMMVNFPEVDNYGHIAGTSASVMGPLMVNIDHQIGRLVAAYGRAGILPQTDFVITSDHAMVPALHTIDQGVVQRIIHQAGGQALYIGHGDYCPIWIKDLAAVPRVAVALANANMPNVQAVYVKDVSGEYRLVSSAARLADPAVNSTYLDLLSTFASGESPDIVLLYGEDTMTMTPGFAKIGRKGDHGGATWGAQHIPLILAGPGVKQDFVSDFPARLVDLAPTVETLLGAQPQNQDGIPLADALIHPSGPLIVRQQRVEPRMLRDVQALEQSAGLQTRR
ncbi:MAG: alkaline phosphatase family protein [Chloroflexota bacterium]